MFGYSPIGTRTLVWFWILVVAGVVFFCIEFIYWYKHFYYEICCVLNFLCQLKMIFKKIKEVLVDIIPLFVAIFHLYDLRN
jgi:hypothetical protein